MSQATSGSDTAIHTSASVLGTCTHDGTREREGVGVVGGGRAGVRPEAERVCTMFREGCRAVFEELVLRKGSSASRLVAGRGLLYLRTGQRAGTGRWSRLILLFSSFVCCQSGRGEDQQTVISPDFTVDLALARYRCAGCSCFRLSHRVSASRNGVRVAPQRAIVRPFGSAAGSMVCVGCQYAMFLQLSVADKKRTDNGVEGHLPSSLYNVN